MGGGCLCHAETVPGVASVEALVRVVAEFVVADLELVAAPAAVAAAQRSLDDSGLLLLGEVHGVRDNPLLARALMQAFGLWGLALEWHENLAPVVEAFLATGTLADHWLLWPGDGRITARHLVVPQWSHGWPPAVRHDRACRYGVTSARLLGWSNGSA
jgi:hypothetical protein